MGADFYLIFGRHSAAYQRTLLGDRIADKLNIAKDRISFSVPFVLQSHNPRIFSQASYMSRHGRCMLHRGLRYMFLSGAW